MLGLADDVSPDSFEFTRADRLGTISFRPEDLHLDDLAEAGEGCEGSRRAIGLKVSYNVTDGLCRSHSQQHVHMIDSRFHNKELILPGLAHFKNLAFDDWREFFSEKMLSVLGRPHQMKIEPVAAEACMVLSPGTFIRLGEVRLRPLTRSVSKTEVWHEPLAYASGWIVPKCQAYRRTSQHSTADVNQLNQSLQSE